MEFIYVRQLSINSSNTKSYDDYHNNWMEKIKHKSNDSINKKTHMSFKSKFMHLT